MKALLIVDVQRDFIPGGALAVPAGDEIIAPINAIQKDFELVVATQDWHPPNHSSFASQHKNKKPFDTIELQGTSQTLWPDHCVQGTPGAEFASALNTNRIEAIFRKGTNPEIDSYSGFYDNFHLKSTGLADYLRGKGVKEVFLCGLAGDVCVYFTALDSLREGFKTSIIEAGTRALDNEKFAELMQEVAQKGVRIV